MARKKLQVKKETKKTSLRKKLQTKKNILDVIKDENKKLFISNTLITDNHSIVIITSDTKSFMEKCIKKFDNGENTFDAMVTDWEDVDLQVEYNRKEQLDIDKRGDIENIGRIYWDHYTWFKREYPSCVYHQVTKWFGKRVNTLVIVLAEEYGKPVAIVKTYEDDVSFI